MEYAALCIAIAMAAGVVGQSLAQHLRIPGIVLLLILGVLLGPGVTNIVQPKSLGPALQILVGFAVAVILFEGGMNLNIKRLRSQAKSIRRLVSLGALITFLGGALTAHWVLSWSWIHSFLFGSLIIVTGPTVVAPIVRRIRLKSKLATILEAEGVFIDAVGALIAVIALEVAISPSRNEALAEGALNLVSTLGFGLIFGLVGGLIIAFLLRFESLIPEGFENVYTLSMCLALFQLSNYWVHESGIMSVIIAGLIVGNWKTRALEELREFKEQLSMMLIGMLFILLAADVGLSDVVTLGWSGVITVLIIMFVLRPLAVYACTWKSDLTAKEKIFLSWLAPRGIVAAAIATLFAQELATQGDAMGNQLRAMVFLVIAVTVVVQGLSSGFIAGLLGLRKPGRSGYVILGANPLARTLAKVLKFSNQEVVFIESNFDACRDAEAEKFKVLYGSGLDEGLLQRAELESRSACISLTQNNEVNVQFLKMVRNFGIKELWTALQSGKGMVSRDRLGDLDGKQLFFQSQNLDLWIMRLKREQVDLEAWKYNGATITGEKLFIEQTSKWQSHFLPMAIRRGHKVLLTHGDLRFQKEDTLYLLVPSEDKEGTSNWMKDNGFNFESSRKDLFLSNYSN